MSMAYTLFSELTAAAEGSSFLTQRTKRTFQFKGSTTAGAGAAEVDVEGSLDGSNWEVLNTITLTLGTTEIADGVAQDSAWKYVRGNLKSISGTGAKATLMMGA